ncbi:class I adenylate-forming enzyme family protein, partial [Actinomadura sp. 7K507]|uniref:AMP-binding protein n=1 Tax=Actinomadura sp. 7K507 TaxID=2530365 RepID=UPI0014055D59
MSDLVEQTFPSASASEFGRSLIAPGGPYAVVEEDVLGERMAVFEKRPTSILELLTDATAAHPGREYLADEDRRLTYGEHLAAVAALARILRDEHGVTPGDRVGLCAANCIEWVIAFWATQAAGAVTVAMNGLWSDPEIESAVALVEPRVVLGDTKRLDAVARAAPG